MTTGGWIVMLASVLGMTCLLGWCVYRVIFKPETSEHMHSQADIEPNDLDKD